jgi:hypothetical protein
MIHNSTKYTYAMMHIIVKYTYAMKQLLKYNCIFVPEI